MLLSVAGLQRFNYFHPCTSQSNIPDFVAFMPQETKDTIKLREPGNAIYPRIISKDFTKLWDVMKLLKTSLHLETVLGPGKIWIKVNSGKTKS